jgi:hypothetical protein
MEPGIVGPHLDRRVDKKTAEKFLNICRKSQIPKILHNRRARLGNFIPASHRGNERWF